jgi:hypothetical protein
VCVLVAFDLSLAVNPSRADSGRITLIQSHFIPFPLIFFGTSQSAMGAFEGFDFMPFVACAKKKFDAVSNAGNTWDQIQIID